MEWMTLSGQPTDVSEFLDKYSEKDWKLYIGTDSQSTGSRHRNFATVLVAWKEGTGAYAIQRRSKSENIRTLHDQLMQETWLSIEQAQLIQELVDDKKITIHMDVNQNTRYDSGKFQNELVGFVKGLGYDYALKPNAWVASGVADRKVRNND